MDNNDYYDSCLRPNQRRRCLRFRDSSSSRHFYLDTCQTFWDSMEQEHMTKCMINNVLQIYDFINCCLTCCNVESESDSSFPYCENIAQADVPAQCRADIRERNPFRADIRERNPFSQPTAIDFEGMGILHTMCFRQNIKYKCLIRNLQNNISHTQTCDITRTPHRRTVARCDLGHGSHSEVVCCFECCLVEEESDLFYPYCGKMGLSDVRCV